MTTTEPANSTEVIEAASVEEIVSILLFFARLLFSWVVLPGASDVDAFDSKEEEARLLIGDIVLPIVVKGLPIDGSFLN